MNDAVTITNNTVVAFHYRMGELGAGEDKPETWLESSFDGEAVYYLHGHGNLVRGLEAAMAGRQQGDEFTATIPPEDAYGQRRENATQRVPLKHLHRPKHAKPIKPGDVVTVQTEHGPRAFVALKAGKFNVDIDLNHPLAGATLYYEVKIEAIRTATREEIAHGHVHGPGGHQH